MRYYHKNCKKFNIALLIAIQCTLCGCGGNVSAQDIFDHYEAEREQEEDTYDRLVPKENNEQLEDGLGDINFKDAVPDVDIDTEGIGQDIKDQAGQVVKDIKDKTDETVKKTGRDTKNLFSWMINELRSSTKDFKEALLRPTGLRPPESHTSPEEPQHETVQSGIGPEVSTDESEDTEPQGRVPDYVTTPPFDISQIGAYNGSTRVTVNGGQPYFPEEDLVKEPFELYSPLDGLGRCGTAYANICPEIMPSSDRGDIGMVKPSGWNQNKYEILKDGDNPGGYLYNRCHLIAYSLAGENANPLNLITGTRHFNTYEGMETREMEVLNYVKSTGNHVLYRVTPVFEGNNLLAAGVLMEGRSVEDNGICFCEFIYNVQPGIDIDYATGENRLSEGG